MIVLRLAMAKRDALREPAAFSSGQLLHGQKFKTFAPKRYYRIV